MLATKILDQIHEYQYRRYFEYSNGRSVIILNTNTHQSWINDDSFFSNIMIGCDTLTPVEFRLIGDHTIAVSSALVNRIIPNLESRYVSLGIPFNGITVTDTNYPPPQAPEKSADNTAPEIDDYVLSEIVSPIHATTTSSPIATPTQKQTRKGNKK